jgi:hypothetical protein
LVNLPIPLSKNCVRRLNRHAILSRSIESTKIAAGRLSKSRFQPASGCLEIEPNSPTT